MSEEFMLELSAQQALANQTSVEMNYQAAACKDMYSKNDFGGLT